MNVLYLSPEDQFTLYTPATTVSGALGELRLAAQSLKIRGEVTLVMDGKLDRLSSPELNPKELGEFLDSKYPEFRPAYSQAKPTVVALLPKGPLQDLTTAARAAGLKTKFALPFISSALQFMQTLQQSSAAVVVHETTEHFTTYTLTPTDQQMLKQKKNKLLTTEKVFQNATTKLRASGTHFTALLISDATYAAEALPSNFAVEVRRLSDVLAVASVKRLSPAALSQTDEVAQLHRDLPEQAKRLPGLAMALLAALVLNGGLYATAELVSRHNAGLAQTVTDLSAQVTDYEQLTATNAALTTRLAQTTAIMAAKGPLAADLPLIASRIQSAGGTLSKISGPAVPTETDTRAFGAKVPRTYQLQAQAPSGEQVALQYGQAGLLADIQNVDCAATCKVVFRVAPVNGQGR